MNEKLEQLDFSALAELKEVMEDEFEILLETFLTDSAERVEQIKVAASLRDADELSRAAHSFKGSCTNIGVPILAQLCMEVELKGKNSDLEGIDTLVTSIEDTFEEVSRLLKDHIA